MQESEVSQWRKAKGRATIHVFLVIHFFIWDSGWSARIPCLEDMARSFEYIITYLTMRLGSDATLLMKYTMSQPEIVTEHEALML